jgi:hypothetical protein
VPGVTTVAELLEGLGRGTPTPWRLPEWVLAETPSATPTTVPHVHRPRKCSAGTWTNEAATGSVSRVSMNPGFFDAADDVVFDPAMNAALAQLLVTDKDYRKLLDRASVTAQRPSGKDRIRIALVDLTKGRICKPDLAGWDCTRVIAGGSTAKIGVLYALEQLHFDLQQLARTSGATNAKALKAGADAAWSAFKCPPDRDWLFTITDGPLTVAKSANLVTFREHMVGWSFDDSTERASELILRIGFEYLASVLWQSGLRHPTREGIWFPSTYCRLMPTAPFDARCHSRKCQTADCKRICWTDDPLGLDRIRINALSVATFLTLLAQERLVTDAASRDMEGLLKGGCGKRIRAALPAGATLRATKCGVTSEITHEAALIQNGTLLYAVAILVEAPEMGADVRKRLLADLEQLIRTRNP